MKTFSLLCLLLFACGDNDQNVPTQRHSVLDYGATANDATDDTDAIQAAIDAALQKPGSVVYFPAGRYIVSKRGDLTSFYIGVPLAQHSDISFVGDGPGSVIQSAAGAGTGGDWYIFRLVEAKRVRFADLMFDGNQDNQSNMGEQTHSILIHKADDVTIERVSFYGTWGDGVKFWGEAITGKEADRIVIRNCRFWHSRRNGITLQRSSKHTIIAGNQFWDISDSSIDFEPTGGETLTHTLITGNLMDHTGSTTASVTLTNGSHVQFVGNQLTGVIHSVNLRESIIADNIIDGLSLVGNRPGLDMIRAAHGVIIKGNRIAAAGLENAIQLSYNNGQSPTNITVANNHLIGASGVNITGGDTFSITGNIIEGANGIGVNAQAIGSDIVRLNIHSNTIYGTAIGVQLYGQPNAVQHATMIGNITTAALPSRFLQGAGGVEYKSFANTWDSQ